MALNDAYLGSRNDLANDIAMLRSTLKESVQAYALRVDGMITEAVNLLAEDPLALGPTDLQHRHASMLKARKLFARLKVKAHKGRRKDLRAIEDVAGRLRDLVAEW